jgi:hypothetical protein
MDDPFYVGQQSRIGNPYDWMKEEDKFVFLYFFVWFTTVVLATVWVTILSLVRCGGRLYLWWRQRELDAIYVNERVADFARCEDLPDDTPNDAKLYPRMYVNQVAHMVRNKLGIPKLTAANKEVARQLAVKFMSDKGHRPSHITRDLEHVMMLVFTPTEEDIRAAQLFNNYALQDKRSRYLIEQVQ